MKQTPLLGSSGAKIGKYAFFLGSAATLIGRADAQTTAAVFTFENSYSTGTATNTAFSSAGTMSGMLTAEIGTGTAIGVHAAAATTYSFPAGYGSVHAFSSNDWGIGDYYQFTINATGYTNLTVSFDMARSSTGPSDFVLQYSTDGTNFTNFTSFAASTVSFSTSSTAAANYYAFDLSGVSAALSTGTDYFRLSVDSSASGTAGTDRVDNFSFGTPAVVVPEPSSMLLLSVAGAGAVLAARRRQRA